VPATIEAEDSTGNEFVIRGLRAEFIDYTFFMNTTPQENFLYTSAAETGEDWYAGQGWSGFETISVVRSSADNSLQIEATDATGAKHIGNVPVESDRIAEYGTDGAFQLFRLNGAAASFIQEVVTQNNEANAEGELTSAFAANPSGDTVLAAAQDVPIHQPVILPVLPVDGEGEAEGEGGSIESVNLVDPFVITAQPLNVTLSTPVDRDSESVVSVEERGEILKRIAEEQGFAEAGADPLVTTADDAYDVASVDAALEDWTDDLLELV
ncbi:MAG: hypothetical protein ACC628_22580, partial [Pirellulaceae bacterium]